MADERSKRANLNIVVSLLGQVVALVCGLITPRLLLKSFGTEVYGATTSIAQFLAYITLLEGGVSGVARAVLYKPLASNDMQTTSVIVAQIKRFFKTIGFGFLAYVLLLAFVFKDVADVSVLDWSTTFFLVIVISISSFAQYFIGATYAVLIQASQRSYVTISATIITTVLNTLLVVLLVEWNCNVVVVKLVSGCVFALRPVLMWLYVKKNFKLEKKPKPTEENMLKQKWTALGQHLAYFLHSNTDIAVLTVMVDLKAVAVYSVYNMVIVHIQNFATSFSTGMEALFGDMLAKKEHKQLHATFDSYEALLAVVGVVLFSVTAALILPFIRIYTSGLTDANYHQPVFAILLIVAALLYCMRTPYHSTIMAAGHFKQTRMAAYGETVINVGLSVLLVGKFGLAGVAMGTLVATAFRYGYYIIYLSKHILQRSCKKAFLRIFVNFLAATLSVIAGMAVYTWINRDGYLWWAVSGAISTVLAVVITFGINTVFYRKEMGFVISKILRKGKK